MKDPNKGGLPFGMPNIMQKSPLVNRDLRLGPMGPVNIPGGVYGPEQPFRKHDRETQEVARLRRLADVRSVVHSSRHQSMPPKPPLPQLLSPGGGSAPNLHDFATRTHLARIDMAYQKLDEYVEQSVEQLLLAMNEQREKLEDWVEKKMSASEEKLAAAVATVQQTRSVLDSAVSSLSATGKANSRSAEEANLRSKLTSLEHSLEERQAATNLIDSEMRERFKTIEERQAATNLTDAEVREQLKTIEERVATTLAQQATTPKPDRLAGFEDKLSMVTAQTAALETVIADLARSSSDNSVTKDMQGRIFEARTDSLQAAVSDLAAQLEACRVKDNTTSPRHDRAGLEERFAAMQAQLTSSAASHTALEAALSAIADRQSAAGQCEASKQREETAYQLDMQAELLREVEQKLQDQAATLDMRSASLQALVEEKVGSLEEKLRDGCLVVSEKSGCEVVLSPKSSSAPAVEQLTQAVQEVLDRIGAIEAKAEELRSSSTEQIAELNSQLAQFAEPSVAPSPSESPPAETEDADAADELQEKVSQDVQMGLADLFRAAKAPTPQPSPKALRELEESSPGSQSSRRPRLDMLERRSPKASPKNASSSSRSDGVWVARKEFLELKAQVNGGFDALIVKLTTVTWMMEEAGVAADRIVQGFSFNLDNRVTDMETRMHKSEIVVDKLMKKNNMKVKKVEVTAHCLKCGRTMPAEADTCQHCGSKKPVRQMQVPKRAVRAAQEHNYHMMKIAFDLWARGPNAKCLTNLCTKIAEESGADVTPITLTRSESRAILDSGCPITHGSRHHLANTPTALPVRCQSHPVNTPTSNLPQRAASSSNA